MLPEYCNPGSVGVSVTWGVGQRVDCETANGSKFHRIFKLSLHLDEFLCISFHSCSN